MGLLRLCFLAILWQLGHAQNDAGGGFQPAPEYMTLEQARKQLLYPHEPRDLKQIMQSKALHDEPLTFRLPFFGFEFRYIWVHRDGCLMFNYGLQEYKNRLKFPLQKINKPHIEEDPSLISPWFARQDIPSAVPDAGVYFRVINIGELNRDNHEENILRERIRLDFQEGMIGSSDFEPKYALIATWKNVTYTNRRDKEEIKTNTYQAVIATDEKRTYAMFNYAWITWTSSADNFDGTKGTPPFIGFNAGNRTRSYEYEPYSQEQRVNRLPELGFGNNLKGRFYFQIDEEIWPGCCIERELDVNWPTRPRLTFFPRYGSMLGGTMVNLTGPCFLNKKSIIRCKFDTLESDGFWRTPNHVSCISPAVMYHGYVDLSVSVDNGPYLFLGKYYVQPPDMVEADVTVLEGNDRLEDPRDFVLHWNAHKLTWNVKAPVTLSLWGYRESNDNYPRLTYIDVLTDDGVINENGINSYRLDLEPFRSRWNWDKQDVHFGFIAVNLTNPETSLSKDIKHSPVVWSRPMPLAWYFRHQWIRRYGQDWKDDMCQDWYYREKYSDRFAITLFRCPCTLEQARLDRGRFAPDLQCNEIDRKCETFHKAAYHCIRSGRPAVGGAGQLCCYDDHGELMRTGDTMYGGRPARAFHFGKHPFKQRMMIPALSYWLHDVSPYFFCCKWAKGEDDAESCAMFKYWRTSQDCSLYQPPGVASVFGDPHYVTFDRVNYTFNGKGEFVLTRVNHKVHKLDVQGRFEQPLPRRRDGPPVNGTRLMAVTAKDNISSIVEFRVRPEAARWQYHMYIIVDREYVYFWDNSMRVQYFKGVTLYQPANVYNMSHIVAMFDSGAGVEVMVENGHMAVHVYLPLTYLNKTAGLLGNWSRVEDDDFTSPNGEAYYRPGAKTETLHNFGNEWRLTEIENDRVGVSLFFHNAVPFSEYDNATFKPQFEIPTKLPETFPYKPDTLDSVCSNSNPCKFDFVVTGDIDFAVATKNHENYAQKLAADIRKPVVRCPELPKPRFGRKTDIRYYVGTSLRFICNDGYRLVGYENRYCRKSGLWSWGVDPECISEADYSRKVAGISVGIVIPLLLVGILACVCLVGHMRQRKDHYTGERGMYNQPITELKSNVHRNGPAATSNNPNGKKKLENDV